MNISKEQLQEDYEVAKDMPNKWVVLGEKYGIPAGRIKARYRYYFGKTEDVATKVNTKEKTETKTDKEEKVTAESIAKEVIDGILKQDARSISVKYDGRKKGKIKEDCVLVLSDLHIGKKNVFFDPVENANVETYNEDIMWKQGERLINSIYKINDILLPSYMFEKLHIFCAGDILDNHMIYPGQAFSVNLDVGKQIWVAVKLFVEMIDKLLVIFKNIEIDAIPGNHGRMSERPMDIPVSSNFDYQVMKIIDTWYRKEPRVIINAPESWYMVAEIKGWKYFIHHGNTVYSWMSLPYYGIVRQSKARRLELQYDIEVIGHFHTRMEIPTSSKTYTLVNGSWISKDTFGWKKFGALSKPEQYFFGISNKRPVSWKFELDLGYDDTNNQ
jgi:predicted phosphodiesterase